MIISDIHENSSGNLTWYLSNPIIRQNLAFHPPFLQCIHRWVDFLRQKSDGGIRASRRTAS
jgi:hypothetical protein